MCRRGVDQLRILWSAVVPLRVRVSDECALFIMYVDFECDYAPVTVERTLIHTVGVQHPNARHKQPGSLVDEEHRHLRFVSCPPLSITLRAWHPAEREGVDRYFFTTG